MTRIGLLTLLPLAWIATSLAAAAEFDFKDPKGVNCMYFLLDSELEPIMGLASGISGKVNFDPADAKKTSGKILVAAESLHIDNKGMKDTLHGADWLDVKQNAEISFTFKAVKDAKKTSENSFELMVAGEFLCKGVTKEMIVPVRATFMKGAAGNRNRGAKGDLLVLRTEFKIARKDFGIKPEMAGAVVADDIQIRASIVGMAPEK